MFLALSALSQLLTRGKKAWWWLGMFCPPPRESGHPLQGASKRELPAARCALPSPFQACHSATYFGDVQHIQAWLSPKGTP
ncbi:hypothetical protein N7481_002718 [Penicillium waksmanii]|uniref:uncharacterized protein n=1 Tax=Penicillium waksmanii TaxID=69791 RepID=UPI002549BAEF|nr:uncharacterized protein N7481_002718 [Penicillium waksmanii]KAJ5995741.1 hypothetical protein N7481_002718 [Penicillium waksmanii]